MELTIPLYVEERKGTSGSAPTVVVRPLFFPTPVETGESLHRTVNRVAKGLRERLSALGTKGSHEELARYGFCPEVEEDSVHTTVEVGQRRIVCDLLVVTFRALDRRIALVPDVSDVWFEVARGEDVATRTVEVLTRHFREQAKKYSTDWLPDRIGTTGRAWTMTIDLSVSPSTKIARGEELPFALLGGGEVRDGDVELRSVGRCLDWLYPEDLDRAAGRDREVEELGRLLAVYDRRPVLLVGPRMVGKTAVVHEHVFRTVKRRGSPYAEKRNVWLIAPQRLISGMSYVGQWENRLLAILKEARLRRHTLYFDDLVGLFAAGTHMDSSLGVAHVLKPYLERREVRVLAETTPEALRVLREIDRGFADLFHILPIREMDEDATLSVLLSLRRQLEQTSGCRFETDALPAVLDVERRYARDAAFPGKAAAFMRQLAVKYRKTSIARKEVLDEFHARSGLAVSFLDAKETLERSSVVEALEREIIGQQGALGAAADVVCVAKARLNDPGRPLATLLFLGPTGVGKTQTAKALAAYLFGDADRLVRFDMNEFVSPASAARLVGTLDRPEGLLTSAIRRQPFSVVLLDEIEKATPDVFDLLLQVTGEGRLTDAVGRTADFTNAIVMMTSNLGVREATSTLGFRQDEAGEGAAYVAAARRYFRPEFFNRLDRIVPFERLRRDDVGRVAQKVIQGIFARDGLVRRRCVLHVDEEALDRIVDCGFHPTLGARALKRAVQRQLTAPLAERLAPLLPETPTVICIYPDESGDAGQVSVDIQGLVDAAPMEPAVALELLDRAELLDRLDAGLERIERTLDALRPEGPLDVEALAPEQYRYFAASEQLRRVRGIWRREHERSRRPSSPAPTSRTAFVNTARQRLVVRNINSRGKGLRQLWREILAAEDVRAYLREALMVVEEAAHDAAVAEIAREAALLGVMAAAGRRRRGLVVLRSLENAAHDGRERLYRLHRELFEEGFELDVEQVAPGSRASPLAFDALVVAGPHALELARATAGTHMFMSPAPFAPVEVAVRPLEDGEEAAEAARTFGPRRQREPFAPVVRVYGPDGAAVDLRTGLVTLSEPTVSDLRSFLLATLPHLPELELL